MFVYNKLKYTNTESLQSFISEISYNLPVNISILGNTTSVAIPRDATIIFADG